MCARFAFPLDTVIGFFFPNLTIVLVISYDSSEQSSEDYTKEPPQMPPHLQLTLLNVPQPIDTQQALPRPWHVILNHMYMQTVGYIPV